MAPDGQRWADLQEMGGDSCLLSMTTESRWSGRRSPSAPSGQRSPAYGRPSSSWFCRSGPSGSRAPAQLTADGSSGDLVVRPRGQGSEGARRRCPTSTADRGGPAAPVWRRPGTGPPLDATMSAGVRRGRMTRPAGAAWIVMLTAACGGVAAPAASLGASTSAASSADAGDAALVSWASFPDGSSRGRRPPTGLPPSAGWWVG